MLEANWTNQIDNLMTNLDRLHNYETKIIDQFIDHLWLEDGLSKNTLNSYRFDLSYLQTGLTKDEKIYLDMFSIRYSAILSYKFPTSKARSISRLLAT